jgi:hypothetical protein
LDQKNAAPSREKTPDPFFLFAVAGLSGYDCYQGFRPGFAREETLL